MHALAVPFDGGGKRLDQYLAATLPLSRSRLQALAEQGLVFVDGRVGNASDRLRGGERLEVREPAPAPTTLVPEDLPLTVLFEDADILVVNKAAGMPVHPGAGNPTGTVANAVLFRTKGLAISGEVRPGIVHRLDKDTSGVLVVAKGDDALHALQTAFANRDVEKRYLAWCLGRPADVLDLVTGHRRADGDRRRFTTRVRPEGNARLAHTRGRLLATSGGASALEVELLTGRTHQIRAHLADIGHPLLQDELYGGGQAHKRLKPGPVHEAVRLLTRQALHAARLVIPHPKTGARMAFDAALPDDLARVDAAIREDA